MSGARAAARAAARAERRVGIDRRARGGGRAGGLVALLVSLVALAGALTWYGRELVGLRLGELDLLLEARAREQVDARGFLIQGKLKQLRLRMERLDEGADDFLSESRMQLAAELDRGAAAGEAARAAGRSPAAVTTGLIRLALGKPWALAGERARADGDLERAYLHELARRYWDASQRYEAVLEAGRHAGTPTADYVRLHLGFCYAMLGQYADAKREYLRLLEGRAKEDVRLVAADFLAFVEYTEKKVAGAKLEGLDELARAERLYYLREFKRARELLVRHLADPRPADRQKAFYLLGRCEEEQGRFKPALDAYVDVGLVDLDTHWAKMANRRLLLLGRLYERDKRLADFAAGNLKSAKDDDFARKLDEIVRSAPAAADGADAAERTRERAAALDAAGDRMRKVSEAAEGKREKQLAGMSTAVKQQVRVLVERKYQSIHLISMRDGSAFVAAIVAQDAATVTAATVDLGQLTFKRADITGIALLYTK